MSNPRYLWVRDAGYSTSDVGDPEATSANLGHFDLLWKARIGEGIMAANAIVQSEEDQPLQAQDIVGCVIKRIRLEGTFVLAPIGLVLPDATTGIDTHARAGTYEGLLVGPAPALGIGNLDVKEVGPGDTQGAVALDWLWWRRRYALNPDTGVVHGFHSTPSAVVAYTVPIRIDTQCSRRIGDWEETLLFLYQGGAGITINTCAIAWSILLERPR